jgi:hypothetical protein
MSDLVKYDRRPETLSNASVATVATIIQISGKSTRTLLRTLSLLKTPPEIQEAIQACSLKNKAAAMSSASANYLRNYHCKFVKYNILFPSFL